MVSASGLPFSRSVLLSQIFCRGGAGPPTGVIRSDASNVLYLKHQSQHLHFHHYVKLLGERVQSSEVSEHINSSTVTNLRKLIQIALGCTPSDLLVSHFHLFDPLTAQCILFLQLDLKGKWFVSISSAVTRGQNPSFGFTWSSQAGCQKPPKATEIDGDNFLHSSFAVYTVTLFNFNLSRD